MILSIPWLVLSLILYNVIAFTSAWPDPLQSVEPVRTVFDGVLFTITMVGSQARWSLKLGDVVILITLLLLFIELIKATRTTGHSVIDHALSMLLFIICGLEFILVKEAATSVFFILLVVTLIDVIAGFSITIRAARRDLSLGAGI